MKTYANYESWAMENAKEGTSIISYKEDRNLTASAGYYKRKILTQRIVVVEGTVLEPVAIAAVKVTFLNEPTKERNERS
jgi:hypothetical protein